MMDLCDHTRLIYIVATVTNLVLSTYLVCETFRWRPGAKRARSGARLFAFRLCAHAVGRRDSFARISSCDGGCIVYMWCVASVWARDVSACLSDFWYHCVGCKFFLGAIGEHCGASEPTRPQHVGNRWHEFARPSRISNFVQM